MSEPTLINDPAVVAVSIVECGEALVRISDYGLVLLDEEGVMVDPNEQRFRCRVGVANRLVSAQNNLPSGLFIGVSECFRPLALQAKYWEGTTNRIHTANPDWSARQVATEAAKFVAPPDIVPPHCTGGAVDVVLIDSEHRRVDMGSGLDERCAAMRTDALGLSQDSRPRRKTLVEAMESAGFVNYGHEWWHFSYGDRYWAHQTSQPHAMYGALG